MREAEVEALRRRVDELERVVADYAARFGLTEMARKAMVGRRKDNGQYPS